MDNPPHPSSLPCPKVSPYTTVGFLREKWIANMVKFPLNLSLKIIKTTVGFLREKELRLWSDLLTFKAEISLQQRLHFSDTKALQLWSDFLQIQAKPLLKIWLGFSDKKRLPLWLDFLQIQSKNHRNNSWISQRKEDCNYGQISIKLKQKIIETTVGFPR